MMKTKVKMTMIRPQIINYRFIVTWRQKKTNARCDDYWLLIIINEIINDNAPSSSEFIEIAVFSITIVDHKLWGTSEQVEYTNSLLVKRIQTPILQYKNNAFKNAQTLRRKRDYNSIRLSLTLGSREIQIRINRE